MKLLKVALITCVIVQSIAQAGIPVIDPTNLVQNTITAIKTFEQLNRDIRHMESQLKSLSSLGWNDSFDIKKHLQFYNSVHGRVNSAIGRYRSIDQQFERMYSPKGKSFGKKYDEWNQETENAVKASMAARGYMLEDSSRNLNAISTLVEKQRNAEGTLQAVQTLAELNAIQARQIEDLKILIALDSQAKQAHLMEQKGEEKLIRERSKHLLKGWNEHSKSNPMNELPKLGQKSY